MFGFPKQWRSGQMPHVSSFLTLAHWPSSHSFLTISRSLQGSRLCTRYVHYVFTLAPTQQAWQHFCYPGNFPMRCVGRIPFCKTVPNFLHRPITGNLRKSCHIWLVASQFQTNQTSQSQRSQILSFQLVDYRLSPASEVTYHRAADTKLNIRPSIRELFEYSWRGVHKPLFVERSDLPPRRWNQSQNPWTPITYPCTADVESSLSTLYLYAGNRLSRTNEHHLRSSCLQRVLYGLSMYRYGWLEYGGTLLCFAWALLLAYLLAIFFY